MALCLDLNVCRPVAEPSFMQGKLIYRKRSFWSLVSTQIYPNKENNKQPRHWVRRSYLLLDELSSSRETGRVWNLRLRLLMKLQFYCKDIEYCSGCKGRLFQPCCFFRVPPFEAKKREDVSSGTPFTVFGFVIDDLVIRNETSIHVLGKWNIDTTVDLCPFWNEVNADTTSSNTSKVNLKSSKEVNDTESVAKDWWNKEVIIIGFTWKIGLSIWLMTIICFPTSSLHDGVRWNVSRSIFSGESL